jgi:hypothetical protein
MKTFEFFLDEKVTTWYRTPFEIEAKTLKEAKEKAIKFVQNGKTESLGWDHIEDTIELMSVEDNGGVQTKELFDPTSNVIWTNEDSK